jgi:type I restriction enzyme M protein
MLDTTTKRNIDAARNVLVGKVPDPKAQVEQITTALIYKFMDDLDKESGELGGEAKFFTGDFEKFSWTKLIDTRLTGEGRLDLYVQSITSMDKNPNLPQLFRDIFKGAFLPYNDPQTLTLFLKEINKFNYGHSEELGNAFEYLLSVLGSQGDAGQFRTPRHIIDFIVEVIDPKKNETILDPACGTAGFLISAYKHIHKQNSSNFRPDKKEESVIGETAAEAILHDNPVYQGDMLTPRERKKLMENIQGYDISPDMVRLSLVNLYLHGFPGPKIFEYDTLSSEKRWGETFDVILANPPFMTPKGGIRPHKRFQVQASRSEVLFVDYILEHLNINGRAGIIVPEGIIFKTENAYKRLRKLLIEDGLFAVVSLPSGVFNPYSGVKTSILMFDNQVAKKVDEILFIKIENDGFDLGAQRRKIKKNDLPEALEVITTWKKGEKQESNLALWVTKEKITEDGDNNLTGERYREVETHKNQNWPLVELKEVAEYVNGFAFKPRDWKQTGKKIIRIQNLTGTSDKFNYTNRADIPEKYLVKRGDLLISWSATIGFYIWDDEDAYLNQHIFKVLLSGNILKEYLYHLQKRIIKEIIGNVHGNTMQHITKGRFESIKIPLPPLDKQKEIVEQIHVKQGAIDAAKKVIENLEKERRFFGHELRQMENVEWKEIGEICDLMTGGTPASTLKEYYENGTIKWIVSGDIHKGEIFDCDGRISELGMENSNTKILPIDSVLIALNGQGKTRGTVAMLRTEATCNQSIVSINPKDKEKLIPEFLFCTLRSMYQDIRNITGDKQRRGLNMSIIRKIKILVPSLELQKNLISEMGGEKEMINANQRLIEIMGKRIEKVLEGV